MKIILAGYSSELIRLIKKCDLKKLIAELYGKETDLFWGVKFIKIDNLYRHPSQLYEAFFEGILLFIILMYLRSKISTKIPGFISAIFLIIYSIFRFVMEFLRVPDEHLGYILFDLSMGQIISFIFLIIGCYLSYTKYEFKK